VRSAPDAVHVGAERRRWRRRGRHAVGLSSGERRGRPVDHVHRRHRSRPSAAGHADAEQRRQWRQRGRRGPPQSTAAAAQTPAAHLVIRAPASGTPKTPLPTSPPPSLSPAQPAQPVFGLDEQPELLYERR